MLNASQITKSYGIKQILTEVSLVVNGGERVALTGANGCGKSTLLRILAGAERADSGTVSLSPGDRLGWLDQNFHHPQGATVGEVVLSGLGEWQMLRDEVERLACDVAAAAGAQLDRLLAEYDRALARFQAQGGYAAEHQARVVLAQLGLPGFDLKQAAASLSGGEQSRIQLASVLLGAPDLLLLDEPTNHLDIEGLEWLEDWLAGFNGGVLLVSHDRVFLDRIADRVLELEDGRLQEYHGNYSQYAMQRAARLERRDEAWRDQQAEIRRIEQDIARTRAQAKHVELTTTSRQPSVRRYAKKVARKAASREKKLKRYLASDERVEKPLAGWSLNLDFETLPRAGRQVLELLDVGQQFSRWMYRHVSLTVGHGERIALLGSNGSGKSTLLRSIVGELVPTEGRIRVGEGVRIGYLPQKQDTLAPDLTALQAIRGIVPLSETEARNFLHSFLFSGDDVFVPAARLSPGERARLLLACVIAGGSNCLVLDEPLNHLDIPSREHFERALAGFQGAVLIAVHDRVFIDRFASAVWALQQGQVRRFEDRQAMLRPSQR